MDFNPLDLILHLDVYRLSTFQEVIDLGFEELLDPGAILVVEWGQAVEPAPRTTCAAASPPGGGRGVKRGPVGVRGGYGRPGRFASRRGRRPRPAGTGGAR